MTTPRYAQLAARALAAHREPDPGSPALEDRARAIGAIAAALKAKRRARSVRLGLVGIAAVAASVAAVGVGLRAHHAAPVVASASSLPALPSSALALGAGGTFEAARAPLRVVVHPEGDGALLLGASGGSSASLLLDGAGLALGAHVAARPGGRALLAFSTGTRLTLDDGGDVTLVDAGATSVIALGHGGLRADVAKLHEHERFLVRTDDAEIEVRGTSFHVEATPGASCAGASTRVDVYEGVVVVRHAGAETRLGPGDSWPAGCAQRAAAVAPAAVSVRRSARASAAPSGPSSSSVSSLAAQNDLFGGAVSAKQRGDASGAIERFDEFVTRYPTSPLAESAAAQRMKLLHAIDSDRTDAAAHAYLARWPEGFARAEAEGILAGAR